MKISFSGLCVVFLAVLCIGDVNAFDAPSIHLEAMVDLKPGSKRFPLTLILTNRSNREVGNLYAGAKVAFTLFTSKSERKNPIFPVPRDTVPNAVYAVWLRPGESKTEIVYLPRELANTVNGEVVASIKEGIRGSGDPVREVFSAPFSLSQISDSSRYKQMPDQTIQQTRVPSRFLSR